MTASQKETSEARGAKHEVTAVNELSYTDASRELDEIVEFFERREVDVDLLVSRLERATAIVDELDKRLRRTRAQVEELVPRLEEAVGARVDGGSLAAPGQGIGDDDDFENDDFENDDTEGDDTEGADDAVDPGSTPELF